MLFIIRIEKEKGKWLIQTQVKFMFWQTNVIFFFVYMENIAAYSKSDMGMFGSSQGVLSLKKKKVGNKKELTFGSVLGNKHFT